MDCGVCHLTVIPVRFEPSHRSEMVSQLMFGETFSVLETEGNWLRIQCWHDKYEGWVDGKQVLLLDEESFDSLNNNSKHYALETVHESKCVYRQLPVLLGSPLPFFNKSQFTFFSDTFTYHGEVLISDTDNRNEDFIKQVSLKFLDTPYLWGGRSIFGVDCSGFTQIIYKLLGISLHRDSKDQATQGQNVYFIHEAQTGDLAFFDNEEGLITHVGLLLNNNQIIHASGKVRMDSIDQQGIFNNESRRYTHNLRLIKRFF